MDLPTPDLNLQLSNYKSKALPIEIPGLLMIIMEIGVNVANHAIQVLCNDTHGDPSNASGLSQRLQLVTGLWMYGYY